NKSQEAAHCRARLAGECADPTGLLPLQPGSGRRRAGNREASSDLPGLRYAGGPADRTRAAGRRCAGALRTDLEENGMSTATYLYCLVHSPREPSLRDAPAGLPGAGRPRAIDAGDGLWLVAADAPLDRYGEEPIEKGLQDLAWVSSVAVPHEAVIEHLAKAGTVVPMKPFNLLHSDDRALEHVAKQRRRIDRLVERIEGREEWGLRVTLDEISALEKARDEARDVAGRGSPGAAFLL